MPPIPIVALQPSDLVGMDFTGAITPRGADGSSHIHLLGDYHSRFVFLHTTKEPSGGVLVKSWKQIVPIKGYPREIYCDNASCYTSGSVKRYFDDRGTSIVN